MARIRCFASFFRKQTTVFTPGACRHLYFVLALLLLLALLPPHNVQAARQVPAGQIQDALSCRPFLDWMLDPGGRLNIQDISSPERQHAFTPLDMRFPPHQAGTLWLRFTLGQRAPESRPATLLLDMGDGIPGTPLLFAPKNPLFASTAEWQDIQPSQRFLFLLPDAQADPQTMYIRLEGLPSPWFAPMLRTPHNAATNSERMIHPAILAALGVVMLLCLLRWLTERGQWRIWTGLYTGAALAYAVYGIPATPEGIVPMRELPGVLAPGIALMLLPHIGRHLMQTRDRARSLDIQFLLLSLPGAVLALFPLVPGFAWTSYYLALWPLATMLFVPTSLGAWLYGLPGARRFLLACLASMIGAAAGTLGMYALVSSPLLPASPLLGVTLGALFIAGMAKPEGNELDAGQCTAKAQQPTALEDMRLRLLPLDGIAAPPPVAAPAQQAASTHVSSAHGSLEDADLRLLSPEEAAATPPVAIPAQQAVAAHISLEDAELRLLSPEEAATPPPVAIPAQHAVSAHSALEGAELRLSSPEEAAATPSIETPFEPPAPEQLLAVRDMQNYSTLEANLRPHLNALLRESAGIALCALPPAARQHAETIASLGRAIASLLDTSASAMVLDHSTAHTVFDLQQLLRDIHNQLAGEAERKGLNISWFMPPHLPQYYSGNAKGVSQVIHLLLESSVRATQQGFVQLTVRRVPESVNPGHLLFTINDSGSGMPPHARNSLALARAWELAGAQGGKMSVESDARGAIINFTLQLKPQPAPLAAMDATKQAKRVIIVDELSGNRQLLAFFLEGLPCVIEEARTLEEAAQACRTEDAALLLLDCDMPEAKKLNLLQTLLTQERGHELPAMPILAITPKGGSGEALADLKNVHRLAKPVTRSDLRKKVLELLPLQETNFAGHEDGRPDAAPPLDLPPPVEYGPGLAPGGGQQFIPLSLTPAGSGVATQAPIHQSTPFSRFSPAGVGELPIPGTQEPVSPLQPFDRQAATQTGPEDVMEETAHQPSSLPDPQQGGLLDWINGARALQAMPQPSHIPAHSAGRHGAATRHAPQQQTPRASFGAHSQYGYQDTTHYDADEWVGEPMPMPRTQDHVSLLRPFDRQAAAQAGLEDLMEETAHQPSSFPDPQQGGLLDWVEGARAVQTMPQPSRTPVHNADRSRTAVRHRPEQQAPPASYGYQVATHHHTDEWVGEPMPVPRTESAPASPPATPTIRAYHPLQTRPAGQRATLPAAREPIALQKPARNTFIPVRLTEPHKASTAPVTPDAPTVPAEPEPLFPEDSSVLGFILGRPGANAKISNAAPPQPTGLARAAKGLVKLVTTRTDASKKERSMPGSPPETPYAARPAFKEQTEPATHRKTERAATERPSDVHSSSTVEQMQPLIPGLLSSLDEAMNDVRRGFNKADTIAVEEAAARIAAKADNYGLRILARMARCVEMAAKARDKDALANILPELETAVERNKIALQPKK